jgi:hypothetical protein
MLSLCYVVKFMLSLLFLQDVLFESLCKRMNACTNYLVILRLRHYCINLEADFPGRCRLFLV